MTTTQTALCVVLMTSSSLAACQAPAVGVAQDETAVRQQLEIYVKSVNAADETLASEIYAQSPDLVVVTPMGRFHGWENVRDQLYVKFLQGMFMKRDLRPSNVSVQVRGDSAWLAYDWEFAGTLADGQPTASKGWETQVYQRTDRGWRIVHLHYSVPPPPPPSTP
jgi:ketosteroid isomerase-like protein